MIKEFNDFNKQMCYINKFITRNTDIELKCQLCGNKGSIRHNRDNPYLVQIICPKCRIDNNYPTKGILPGIPLIDILQHITKEATLDKIIKLDRKTCNQVNKLLNSKLPKGEAIKEVGLTITKYEKIIDLYEKEKDPDIKSKLEEVFAQNRKNVLREVKQLSSYKESSINNIAKLKLEHGISNRDIVRDSIYPITNYTISNISNDKIQPKIKTKIALADVFKCSVADVFPGDYLYKEIYTYQDYLDLNDKFRLALCTYIDNLKESGVIGIMETIAKEANMDLVRVYEFKNNHVKLRHDDFEGLNKILHII